MPSKYGFMAKIGVDTSGVVKAVEDLERQLKNSKTELKYINESLKLDDGNNVAELGQKFETLTEIIKNTRTKLEQLKKSENDVQKAFESGKINESQYAKYKREVESTESSLKQYETQLRATEKQIEKAGRSTDGLKEDTKELKNEIGAAEKSAASFGDIFKANILSDVVMTGVRRLADEFVNFARQGVELASSLSEVQNVVDVTFGNDANVINEWSKNAAESFGLSELAAKQYTGTLGAMLKSSGLAGDAVLQMSQDLTGLAGDLASFYNLDIGTAFEKIRSGISGETEPLKQLGIDMSVANMEAYALSQGIEKAWRNMSQAEKAQLRYSYLLQQTADAQGDFVRTSDSYANQQRITQLQLENISAELGEKLLPVAYELTNVVTDIVPSAMESFEGVINVISAVGKFALENAEAITTLVSALAAFKSTIAIGNAISTAITAFKGLQIALQTQTAAQLAANAAAAANPYVLVASAIATVIAAVASYVIQLDDAVNSEKEIQKASFEIIQASEKEAQITKVKAERYRELYKEYEKTGVASAELKNLAQELQSIAPETIKLIDAETGAYLALDDSINKVIDSIRAKGIEDARVDSLTKYYENIAEYESKIADATIKYYKDIEKAGFSDEMLAEFQKENLGKYYNYLDISKADTLENFDYIHSQIEAFLRIEEERNQEVEKYNSKIQEQEQSVEEINKAYDDMLKKQNLIYSSSVSASSTDSIAQNEEAKGKLRLQIQQENEEKYLKQQEEFEQDLEKGLKELETKYNTHGFMNPDGTKDEKAYFAARKQYLEEHVNKSSEIWWKYYDEITGYEKKSAEDAKAASEKAYEEAEKTRVETIKKSWDEITRQRQRGLITEEDEYKLKAQFVKEYCDESEDTWDEYYNWLYDYISDREADITAEQVKAWESNSKALADNLSDRYEDLVKRKEKVRQELLNIDLAETVTDKDGKEVTVLTDLDAEIQKINRYTASLQKLKQTGAAESLIAEIQNLSYEDGQRQRYIDAILNLSEKSRQLYYNDWERAQQAAEKAAAQEVSEDLEKLNESTAQAVTDIFGGIPQSAYQQGIQTVQSYLQGIIDSMNGINQDLAIQGIMKNAIGAGQQTNKQQEVIALSTPITINLNDKQYINNTIGDLMTQGVITGGNNFNL